MVQKRQLFPTVEFQLVKYRRNDRNRKSPCGKHHNNNCCRQEFFKALSGVIG